MKGLPKTLVTALAVAVVATALLAPIASAGGSTTGAAANGMMGGGTGAWSGTGMWGTGSGMQWLLDDPIAFEAWLQMRTAHQQAMQDWYDTYATDLNSTAAQQALHDLWTTFWNDMKDFYELYGNGAAWLCPSSGMWGGWQMGGMMGGGGWDPGHMWGTGYGASWMMSHPAGFGQWLSMRDRQMSAMNDWWQQNGSAPGSPAARTALRTLTSHQRSQVRSFYRHHNLPVTTTWMRYGAGGWMGLGGMWGGFGW